MVDFATRFGAMDLGVDVVVDAIDEVILRKWYTMRLLANVLYNQKVNTTKSTSSRARQGWGGSGISSSPILLRPLVGPPLSGGGLEPAPDVIPGKTFLPLCRRVVLWGRGFGGGRA